MIAERKKAPKKISRLCSKLTLKSEFCSVLVYKLGINRAVCLYILFALFSFVLEGRCDKCQACIVVFIIYIRVT